MLLLETKPFTYLGSISKAMRDLNSLLFLKRTSFQDLKIFNLSQLRINSALSFYFCSRNKRELNVFVAAEMCYYIRSILKRCFQVFRPKVLGVHVSVIVCVVVWISVSSE